MAHPDGNISNSNDGPKNYNRNSSIFNCSILQRGNLEVRKNKVPISKEKRKKNPQTILSEMTLLKVTKRNWNTSNLLGLSRISQDPRPFTSYLSNKIRYIRTGNTTAMNRSMDMRKMV